MLPGNVKWDDQFVLNRDGRGRRNPAEVPFHAGGRMGWRSVTELAQRRPDVTERGAILLALDVAEGINASRPYRAMASFDDAVSLR